MYFPHEWEVAHAKVKAFSVGELSINGTPVAEVTSFSVRFPAYTLYPHPRAISAERERDIRGEKR